MKYKCRKLFCVFLIALIFSGCGSSGSDKILSVSMSLGEQEWDVFRKDIFPPFESEHDIKIKAFQIESSQLAAKLEALQKSGKSEIDLFAQDNMSLSLGGLAETPL